MLEKFLLLAAILAVLWFVLLRPDLTPTGPNDDRNWFARAYGAVLAAWNTHGSVWKRWACFLGGGAFVLVVLFILGVLKH